MRKKLNKILQILFAYGLGILMIAAILVALGYLISFFIGCPYSEIICSLIDIYILPYMYTAVVVICILGVISMYLCGEYTFMLDPSTHKKNR